MLVLSRKLGESVEIGDRAVTVQVLSIKRSKVQLGIDAPMDVAIHRKEKMVDGGVGKNGVGKNIEKLSREKQCDSTCPNVLDRLATSASQAKTTKKRNNETTLHDFMQIQAEIAALVDLVPGPDRSAAEELAVRAVEQLTAIIQSTQDTRGKQPEQQEPEQPISSFMRSRSVDLQKIPRQPSVRDKATAAKKAKSWTVESSDQSTVLIRESDSSYRLNASPCSLA